MAIPRVLDQALVTVYRRPDAYYLVTSASTTAGVWLDTGPADVISIDTEADALAEAVAAAITPNAVVVPHPRQDQWTEQRRQSLNPLIRQARVRSWKAFIRPATLISIHRRDRRCTITPQRRDTQRIDVFVPIVEHSVELQGYSIADLGTALTTTLKIAGMQPHDV